jgi:hypothetical protein
MIFPATCLAAMDYNVDKNQITLFGSSKISPIQLKNQIMRNFEKLSDKIEKSSNKPEKWPVYYFYSKFEF